MADRSWRRELTKPRPAATSPVAPFAPSGIVDPDMLGSGATGAGDRYLADDGTWKPISGLGGGSGGSVSISTATLNAPYDVLEHTEVVTAAACTPSSLVLVSPGSVSDNDENSPTMDHLTFSVTPGAGSFAVTVSSGHAFGGAIKINYLLGA